MNNDLNSFPAIATFWLIICLLLIFIKYRQIKNIFSVEAANQDLFLLIIFLISFPVYFGASFAVFYFFTGITNASTTNSISFIFAGIVYLLTWYKRKQYAGNVLVNLGQLVRKKILIFELIFFLFVVISNCYIKFSEGSKITFDLIIYILGWVFSIFFLLNIGLSRIDIREKGINFLFTIVEWQSIKEYKWIEPQGNVLYIRHQAGLPLMPILMLQIPSVKKNQVEQLLSRYLPTNSNLS
ncbi:MAG: DUF5673 domain-containing protein [Hydrococcus sp. Prado102]|jgi:hypothetical protein|nr:DUF5673 domain-containing protein [Hydrococcus sp. Prado102]